MYEFLFKSRWFAALWAIATLASIAAFVMEGGGSDKLQHAAKTAKAQAAPAPSDEDDVVEATDEELVDKTAGLDTTPITTDPVLIDGPADTAVGEDDEEG